MSNLTLFQLIITVMYITYIYNKYGLLSSISASTYYLPKERVWVFWGWLASVGVASILQEPNLFGVGTGLGLFVAGLTIWHKKTALGLQDNIHTIATVVALVSAFIGFIGIHGIWLPAVVMLIGTGIFYIIDWKWIWWTECWGILWILIGYLSR